MCISQLLRGSLEIESTGMFQWMNYNIIIFLLILKDYYLGVTLQIVNEDWSLWNLPIAFVPVLGSHTAEAVGNLIADVVAPFLGTSLFTL
jgi:hypothetical protein